MDTMLEQLKRDRVAQVLLVLTGIIGLFVACVIVPTIIRLSSPKPQPRPPVDAPAAAPVQETPPAAPAPSTKTLQGNGQKATELFTLHPGLVVFELRHNGRRNFIVHLLDSDGELIDWLVNKIGPFDGSKAVKIEQDGQYLLDINADGDWSVIIRQN